MATDIKLVNIELLDDFKKKISENVVLVEDLVRISGELPSNEQVNEYIQYLKDNFVTMNELAKVPETVIGQSLPTNEQFERYLDALNLNYATIDELIKVPSELLGQVHEITEEHMIAALVNGKQLYEKMFINKCGNVNVANIIGSVDDLNIEELYNYKAICKKDNTYNYNSVSIIINNDTIQEKHTDSNINNADLYLTIQYTKKDEEEYIEE